MNDQIKILSNNITDNLQNLRKNVRKLEIDVHLYNFIFARQKNWGQSKMARDLEQKCINFNKINRFRHETMLNTSKLFLKCKNNLVDLNECSCASTQVNSIDFLFSKKGNQ